MKNEKLAEILTEHKSWLKDEAGGKRADLRCADLRGASLRGASLRGADLRDADLCHANLRNANLRDADLCHANLRGADLRGADLRDADLCYAYLRGANLRDADLRGADLRDADLRDAIGNMVEIKSVQADTWPVTYTNEVMCIGCRRHAITEWWAFSDKEINSMDEQALKWWRLWKPILQATIAASPAVPTREKQ